MSLSSHRVQLYLTLFLGAWGCGAPLEGAIDFSAVAERREAIVGGQVTTGESNVFYLRMADPSTNKTLGVCTCTLIGKRTILTASHCFSTRTMAKVPKYFVSNAMQLGGGQEIEVIERKMHQGFVDNGQISVNDIALGLLAQEPVGVVPAPIPTEDLGDVVAWPIRVVGYGKTSMGLENSGVKRKVNSVISPSDSNILPGYYGFGISEGDLGAHGGCPGDSGGPSFAQVKGEDTFIGVHSYVYSLTDKLVCGLSADVRVDKYYASFIAPWLKEKEKPQIGPAVRVETNPADNLIRMFVQGKSRVDVQVFDANNQKVVFDESAWRLNSTAATLSFLKGGVEVSAASKAGQFPSALEFSKDGVSVTFDVVIEPGPTSKLTVTPVEPLVPGATVQLEVRAEDAFQNPRTPKVTWGASGGTLSPEGRYTAPQKPGTYEVTATEGGVSTSVTVEVAEVSKGVNSSNGPKEGLGMVVGSCSAVGPSNMFPWLVLALSFLGRRRRSV